MAKKVIVLNASPRRVFNTAKLLKEAQKGAEDAGAEVEYYNLYDFDYKGCLSCFVCKRKGNSTNGLCAIKDDIRPILEKCINADAVIFGTPVYFSYPAGEFRSFLERLLFAAHSYMKDNEKGGLKRVLKRIIPTAVIFTMNCPEEWVKDYNYPVILNDNIKSLEHVMGYSEALYAYDTYQFTDYSNYDCDLFDEKHKAKVRDEQFPIDMKKAFELGKKLAEMNL